MFSVLTQLLLARVYLSIVVPAAEPMEDWKKLATEKDKGPDAQKSRPTTKDEFATLAKAGPLPPWKSFNNRPAAEITHVDGKVVTVSADLVEIQFKGNKDTVKYPPHVLLASGAVCHWQHDSSCYLLDDIKIGDEVVLALGCADKDKGEECFYICVRKRPGGTVPASRKPSDVNPYHERRQKEIDYEDKGQNTPEEIEADREKRKLAAERGLPPPPPLKAPVVPARSTSADPMKK